MEVWDICIYNGAKTKANKAMFRGDTFESRSYHLAAGTYILYIKVTATITLLVTNKLFPDNEAAVKNAAFFL